MWPSTIGSAGIGTASTINAPAFAARFKTFSMFSVASKPSALRRLDTLDRPVVAEDLAACRGRRTHHRAADQAETQYADGRFRHGFKGGTSILFAGRAAGCRLLVKVLVGD